MTWNDKDREKAQRLLEKRVQIGTEIAFIFEAELIQNELAFLGKIDSQSTLFKMSLRDVIEANDPSLDNFETIYERRLNLHNEIYSYDIFLPLYLNFPKRKFQIQNTTILKIPFKEIYLFFTKENLINAVTQSGVRDFTKTNIPKYALKFSVEANNKIEAWNKVSSQFNLLRGIIDFCILQGSVNYTFGTASRTKNDYPQWALLRKPDNNTSEFITFQVSKEPRIKNYNWDKTRAKNLTNILNRFKVKQVKTNSINILANCLRLYSQAMESVHRHNCFLSLWQLGESLTRAETSGGKSDVVLKRLIWHSSAFTTIQGLDISENIAQLSKKRNKLVHSGIDEIQNSDINLLKNLCDLGIIWLIQKHKQLKTNNHLDEFYRHRTSNTAMRRAIIETVKSIE